ncbi:MAG: tyrosine--tRNA ligase [Tepidisphaeraceae bacterium]
MSKPTIDQQIEQLGRRSERILPEDHLRKKLEASAKTGKPLRIKFGMDPTAPDVTLGHAVPLKIIRQFQDWGHKAVIIIGDYTARVGDPSGRNSTRPMLSGEEIDRNAVTYLNQITMILRSDPALLEVRRNSEWLGKMDLLDIIRLAAKKTVGQMLERDTFAERYKAGRPISIHEFIYPLLQGWDSVCIDADVEMGGSDQLFNNLVGRELQQEAGGDGQCVIVTPLLVGLDGVEKMSKSKKNYIGVTDPPSGNDGMFGKTMSIPDTLMDNYYQLLTDVPESQYKADIAKNPLGAKMALARYIIKWFHGPDGAAAAQADWDRRRAGQAPVDMPQVQVGPGPHKVAPLLVKAGLAASNSEGIRKIKEGAVQIDGQKVSDPQQEIAVTAPVVLKLGRKFARVLP